MKGRAWLARAERALVSAAMGLVATLLDRRVRKRLGDASETERDPAGSIHLEPDDEPS